MTFNTWVAECGGPHVVAKMLHLTPAAIRRWLRKEGTPRPKNIQAIVRWSGGKVSHETIITETMTTGKRQPYKKSK